MKGILLREHGGPEVLRIEDLPEPTGPGVAVRVTHVGLNHLDVWVRRGVAGHRFPLPLVPGSDVVGVREDSGEAVALYPATSCKRCDRCVSGRHDLCRAFHIRGETMDGGCRERLIVPEDELLPCPLPPDRAAALPLSLLTAWHMLERARVGVGDRVLVHGGAGGVGSLAIPVARLRGARVVATASTEDKRELCRDLGAEEAWDYDAAVAEAKRWSGEGIDVVVDHVGAATWEASMRMVRWGGTIVTCGATAGHEVPLNLRALFFKQLNVLGSTMGSIGEMRAAWREVLAGRIRPVVDAVLPMTRYGEAQGLLERREVRGKVVVSQDLA